MPPVATTITLSSVRRRYLVWRGSCRWRGRMTSAIIAAAAASQHVVHKISSMPGRLLPASPICDRNEAGGLLYPRPLDRRRDLAGEDHTQGWRVAPSAGRERSERP